MSFNVDAYTAKDRSPEALFRIAHRSPANRPKGALGYKHRARQRMLDAMEALYDPDYDDLDIRIMQERREARVFPRNDREQRLVREAEAGAKAGPSTPFRRSTAYHESGHLVMAAIEGRTPRGAVVFGGGGGRAWLAVGESWPVTADVAGGVAQRLAGYHNGAPSQSDLTGARYALEGVAEGAYAEDWINRAEETAERYLRANWNSVGGIAGCLLYRGWIDGAEALEIMDKHGLRRA